MNVQGLTRKQIAGIAMALVVVGSVMAVAPSVLAQTGDGTDDDGSNATTRSTFDSDDDGWTLKGDAEAIEPIYKASGGNPGGYLFAEDTATGGVYYWNASTKFLGDRSASYGGTLSFDLRQSETSAQFADDDIQLVSGDTTLTYDFGDSSTHPGTDWTPYSVDLRASAGWVNDDTGENATDSEMQAVLGDLTYLRIRGEYHNGADTGSLDNVVMSGPPSDKRTTTTTETTTKEPTEEPTPTETTPSTPTATATPTATVTATPTSTTKPTSERSTTEIDSCTVIDDPGRYVLTQDITDSTESTCIEITADDVVLDSDGHTVDGTDATDSVGVSVVGSASGPTSPDTNVTVAGLVVTDWAVGIQYDGVKNGTISDSSVASNEGEGFGASGISLELTTNVTVTNTSVDANDGNGITLGIDARGNTVSDNTVSANGIGISVEQSSNNRIEANVITENAAGIDIELGGGNLVTDNVVTDNHNGIGLTDTSQNVLSENNISSNNGSGIFVALIGGNTVTDNTVNSNLGTGIVVLSAGGDTISNNTATNNAVWDYAASESTTESVVDLDIGSAIVSFDATDIGLGGVEMPPADPTDYTNIGQYVNTTDIDDTDNDSSLTLNVGYSDADVASANVNESTLRLFVFADGEWSPVESTVDTTTNTVSANVTDFDNGTVFAPLGRTADEDETPNETVYYQVDFVSGKPIENLRDEEGTYSNDELIRFAHGSTDQPMMRLSEGEFTTDDDLAERIESQDIAVEDGTATTTFTVSEGESVTLSLVSYTKPGPGWSPETEPQQEFVDADTQTFGPGTHTLTVDLPKAETNATDRTRRR